MGITWGQWRHNTGEDYNDVTNRATLQCVVKQTKTFDQINVATVFINGNVCYMYMALLAKENGLNGLLVETREKRDETHCMWR